jgi:phosphoglycerate dehydrogenase-like enzyme
MPLHAHFPEPPSPAVWAALTPQLDATIRLTSGPEVPNDIDLLISDDLKREHLIASHALRAVIIPYTGIAPGVRQLMLEFPHIALHNCGWPSTSTAEGMVALMLAAAKYLIPSDRALRDHDWRVRYLQPTPSLLLADKTALILGYGDIGQKVARVCIALGMTVLAVRRNAHAPSPNALPVEIHALTELHRVLPRASVLLIALPLTPETKGLIGAPELALLQRPAVLVNVGRGPIVDEAALYHALCDGTLHAAGLDVWYTYPTDEASRAHTPPSQYPFHELSNVVLSPHRTGNSRENVQLQAAELALLLNAAARGDPMPNRVDVQAGY